jgi:NifB/MoaA-like Fe-S oxidoreductase
MPEINDGTHLEHSLADLLSFYPKVMTVSIVPVGLTNHRKGLPQLKPVDATYAEATIRHVTRIQEANLRNNGTPFCFLGDEFYMLAHHPIPSRSHYGDFPLVENGVGMIRNFLDQFEEAMKKKWPPRAARIRGTVVTGRIFYPVLFKSLHEFNAKFCADLRCLPVDNMYFGEGITVAGLLTGRDIFNAVKDQLHGEFLVVPAEAMTGEEDLFLDDWTRKDLEQRLGLPVFGGGYHIDEFFKLMFASSGVRRRELSSSSR